MENLKQEMVQLFARNTEVKLAASAVAIMSTWLFNGEYAALIAVISLRVLDFMTGTWYALNSKSWTSGKSYSGIKKTGVYFILILVSRLLDKVLPVKAFAPMMDTYIALTEAGSILENLKKMGYDVPTSVVLKVKALLIK